MRTIVKALSILGLVAAIGGVAFAEVKSAKESSVRPESELEPMLPQAEKRSESMGGCVMGISYDYAKAGQTIGGGYKTHIQVRVRTMPTSEVKAIHIWEGVSSRGARLTVNGLDYDFDASSSQERFVTPFLEAARLMVQVGVSVRTEQGTDRDSARVFYSYDKPCFNMNRFEFGKGTP